MTEPLTCQTCGTPDPPPEQTCEDGLDHHVGTEAGCPACGRLTGACVERPCQARRLLSYEAGWDDSGEKGERDG